MDVSFVTLSEFRTFYKAEYGFVWSLVRRLGVPAPLIEDAVQDTFIVAYRRRETFRAGPARPWLHGIARGVASNYRRTARRVARKNKALEFATVATSSHRGRPQASVQALERSLEDMTVEDRRIFVLSEIEGRTAREISETLGLRVRRIYRRLERLRRDVAEQAIDGGAPRRHRSRVLAQGWTAWLTAGRLGFALNTAQALLIGGGVVGLAAVGLAVSPRPPTAESPRLATAFGRPPPASKAPRQPAPPASTAPPSARPPTTAAPPASTAPPSARPPTTAAPPPAQMRVPRRAPISSLSRENVLLQRATAGIAQGQFEQALGSVRLHAAEFPYSAMADLRAVLRVEALCGVGKVRQARGEARTFVADHTDSPLLDKIRRTCVTQAASSGQTQPR